jgi:hypothetical protein
MGFIEKLEKHLAKKLLVEQKFEMHGIAYWMQRCSSKISVAIFLLPLLIFSIPLNSSPL